MSALQRATGRALSKSAANIANMMMSRVGRNEHSPWGTRLTRPRPRLQASGLSGYWVARQYRLSQGAGRLARGSRCGRPKLLAFVFRATFSGRSRRIGEGVSKLAGTEARATKAYTQRRTIM